MDQIAIVGMACKYPDANSPLQLFENALAQRRAFRRIPDERLRLEDYFSKDRNTPDQTYSQVAAVIEGYEFDRVRFRVSGPTFRAADLTHWLALDVASEALTDAGFHDAADLPQETTGVYLGNTLGGEFGRANVMRLRWPYVRRVVESQAAVQDMSEADRARFIDNLETKYKAAFPPVTEETLSGGMSNTIAGRICNYFDLKGGGYTIDAACASSLLSIANATASLESGDLDVAIAGGVDLSLDPFELVGFAKTGALAEEKMRVFDERSAGFWPGEGCGIVVLMRLAAALEQHRHVYAVIRGWGVSSDGSGGMTRPDVEGQLLAVRRAYRRAGFGPETVSYFEAHGTGTAVGDSVELTVLSRARSERYATRPAAVSTLKANIGHTKAAAGVGGLIKAALAVNHRVLPPMTGCDQPHPILRSNGGMLRVLARAERWPDHEPVRAGISAMGFGGINTHVVLESAPLPVKRTIRIPPPAQDAEIFLFAADRSVDILHSVEQILPYASRISESELGDMSATLARKIASCRRRAAVVARSPHELASRLAHLADLLRADPARSLDAASGVFLGEHETVPRIGLLFPGQGSPSYLTGNAWPRRFTCVEDLYRDLRFHDRVDARSTDIAQAAIIRATLAGLRLLNSVQIEAVAAVGHSLGELAALHWAGAFGETALLRIAAARGQAMAAQSDRAGAMASLTAPEDGVRALTAGLPVVIAGLNSPSQTVVSGEATAVASVVLRARDAGVQATELNVSHAFHSPLVAASVPELQRLLPTEPMSPLSRVVFSTVTGAALEVRHDLRELLCAQITSPVRFLEAIRAAQNSVDLWIEAGPGTVLSRIAAECSSVPAISLDAGGVSLEGMLNAVGAAFVLGCPVRAEPLFEGRVLRPFEVDWKPRFFRNPCERAPVITPAQARESPVQTQVIHPAPPAVHEDALKVVRDLIASRAELPVEDVDPHHRLLSDLHLNSITVGQVVGEASRRLGIPPPIAPTQYADARVSEIARALEEAALAGPSTEASRVTRTPDGVDAWIRCFRARLIEAPLNPARKSPSGGQWLFFSEGPPQLTERFRAAFAEAPGGGVVVCLPGTPEEHVIPLLVQAGHAVMKSREGARFVVIQTGLGGAFARTLHLEAPEVTCCVIDVPLDHPLAPEWAVEEATAASGYTEAHFDLHGIRRTPVLDVMNIQDLPPSGQELNAGDVLLVTGGGKGIGAESALHLVRETGARLLLLGRSQPSEDPALAANLQRIAGHGITFRYVSADVTDADSVRQAIGHAEQILGPITAIIHAAGVNTPQLISTLDATAFERTVRPKLTGFRNIVAAVNPERLHLLITFGSLIARTGLPGEADYGIANEWLRVAVEHWASEHRACRCLHLDWSVWAGAGMGERLGRLDALMQRGITPIPIDEGLRILSELVRRTTSETSIVVAGRFGDPPTIRFTKNELPFLRFLENVRVYVPDVELIADSELSISSDPYLDDHVYDGNRLLPAVIGLESMAQVAMALMQTDTPPDFEDVSFREAITVPAPGVEILRVAALVTEPGRCRVVVRSSITAFQVDHFRATCVVPAVRKTPRVASHLPDVGTVPLSPDDIYGKLLFHSGRFRRLHRYRRLHARECVAELRAATTTRWFSRYLPDELVLGDPAMRDAAIHAIQCCIPFASLLPVAVDRIITSRLDASQRVLTHAVERESNGETFTYDVEVCDPSGIVVERWEGLQLRRIKDISVDETLPAPLLGPLLERRAAAAIPDWEANVVVEPQNGTGRQRSDCALRHAAGPSGGIFRRPDGKPETDTAAHVSSSHDTDLVVAVAASSAVSCDVERVDARSRVQWLDLLGADRFALSELLARRASLDFDMAATRVWTAGECLTKADAIPGSPLVLEKCSEPGVAVFVSGSNTIATFEIRRHDGVRVFGFLGSKTVATCHHSSFATS